MLYVYKCPLSDEPTLLSACQELLTTAPFQVRCKCGECHKVAEIGPMPWEPEWKVGHWPSDLMYRPVSTAFAPEMRGPGGAVLL